MQGPEELIDASTCMRAPPGTISRCQLAPIPAAAKPSLKHSSSFSLAHSSPVGIDRSYLPRVFRAASERKKTYESGAGRGPIIEPHASRHTGKLASQPVSPLGKRVFV